MTIGCLLIVLTLPATLTFKTKGEILVKEGQKVSTGDVLAVEEFIPQLISLNIAKFLSTSPKKCLKVLTKKLGEEVKVSEIIAQKKSFFGLRKKIVRSPCDGVLEKVEAETGELIISLPKRKREIKLPVPGIIKKIDRAKGEIIVSLLGEEVKLKEAIGSLTSGKIEVIGEDTPLFLVDRKYQGKIVCAKIWKEEFFEKALALGVAAFLAIELPFIDWEKQKKGNHLLIGEEEEKFIFNIGILEEKDFKILEKNKGKMGIFVPKEKKVIIL